MTVHVETVAFQGIDPTPVDVQVQLARGLPSFTVVGLADKAVAESRERVRAALEAVGLALPPRRITVNLAPADLPKAGSHYDLPIALALMAATGAVPGDLLENQVALGELSLDGRLTPVNGVLPAAISAQARGRGLICPHEQGPEAAWAGEDLPILAPASLIALINHVHGRQVLQPPEARLAEAETAGGDLRDIKGQESAKRALEVAAAGGHNLLLNGPPGAGKSMLAARLPTILPALTPMEALESAMIHSLAGTWADGRLRRQRPFRAPHHTASAAALTGGGPRGQPGEISLAHNGVLFLDELPEFARPSLESLRQPLESGQVAIARAQAHVRYPARVQLVAAMNPCRCGHLDDPDLACGRAPRCAGEYQNRISGPLLDRFDLHVDVPPVRASDLALPPPAEDSATVAGRVAEARRRQERRYADEPDIRANAQADGTLLTAVARPDAEGQELLTRASDAMKLSARGYHRVLRVARTLADLEGADTVRRVHVAEALTYRPLRLNP